MWILFFNIRVYSVAQGIVYTFYLLFYEFLLGFWVGMVMFILQMGKLGLRDQFEIESGFEFRFLDVGLGVILFIVYIIVVFQGRVFTRVELVSDFFGVFYMYRG